MKLQSDGRNLWKRNHLQMYRTGHFRQLFIELVAEKNSWTDSVYKSIHGSDTAKLACEKEKKENN